MDESTVKVIQDLERRRVEALVNRDMALARSLHADDDALLSGGRGRLANEA